MCPFCVQPLTRLRVGAEYETCGQVRGLPARRDTTFDPEIALYEGKDARLRAARDALQYTDTAEDARARKSSTSCPRRRAARRPGDAVPARVQLGADAARERRDAGRV